MGIEDERRDTQRQSRRPEINQVRDPQRQSDIQQHDQRAHSKVYTWSGETRVEGEELHTSGCKSTSSGDVTSATIREVSQDRMTVNLSREDFENRR